MNKTNEINILFVSDIHENFDNLDTVTKYVTSKTKNYDLILFGGDFVTIPKPQEATEEELKIAENTTKKLITQLEKLGQQLIYIPGNHDSSRLFNNLILGSKKNTTNLHKGYQLIGQNLVIAGLGGSVVGIQNGEVIWDAYPYHSNDLAKKDLEQLLDDLKKDKKLPEKYQLILLTHCGPSNTCTSIINNIPQKQILSGIPFLYKLYNSYSLGELDSLKMKFFLNLHGHSHDSQGMSKIGDVKIINAGSVKRGNFSTLKIVKNEEWELKSVKFHLI
ncbi:metallophosphoesterase [Anaeramoeba flamelloides]|uniref:Metallophosphoesterase n=1 Tax=Anaeramoeba flamelloides TaxID=1746091 RepID=A0AAV7ZNL3_9EUKA|nr:metallophosphoesterase [Anaeramoeba flamelloides]